MTVTRVPATDKPALLAESIMAVVMATLRRDVLNFKDGIIRPSLHYNIDEHEFALIFGCGLMPSAHYSKVYISIDEFLELGELKKESIETFTRGSAQALGWKLKE